MAAVPIRCPPLKALFKLLLLSLTFVRIDLFALVSLSVHVIHYQHLSDVFVSTSWFHTHKYIRFCVYVILNRCVNVCVCVALVNMYARITAETRYKNCTGLCFLLFVLKLARELKLCGPIKVTALIYRDF